MAKEETERTSSNNSCGTASVILGILSILFTMNNGLILGIIGLIFGFQQKKKGKNKWSKAGIILNIIGIVLNILILLAIIYIAKFRPDLLAQFKAQLANVQ